MRATLLVPLVALGLTTCSPMSHTNEVSPFGPAPHRHSARHVPQGDPDGSDPQANDARGEAPATRGRVLQQIAVVLARVSALRQLPVRGPVQGRVIDRPTMLRQVKAQVRNQVPPEAIRGESDFLKAFGFLPLDFDYEAGVYGLIENQLAGYFDPSNKTMFLMGDLSASEAEVTLAHELVHALQDQHHDLDNGLRYTPDANDRQSALHCLAEGDATSVMLDYTLAPAGRNALSLPDRTLRVEIAASVAVSPELASFPSILRRSLVAPYIDGILFVHALRRRGGWQAVEGVWASPPSSTEQVLHLDKLDVREPVESVPAPDASGFEPGFSESHRDTYGEQGLRTVLEEWMPRRSAEIAAAGWGGDRATVLVRGTGSTRTVAAAWHIRFDPAPAPSARNAEAVEAVRLITQAWGVRLRADSTACRTLDDGRVVGLAMHDRDLGIVALPTLPVSDVPHPIEGCALASRWAKHVSRMR